jgi:hypothetical protein
MFLVKQEVGMFLKRFVALEEHLIVNFSACPLSKSWKFGLKKLKNSMISMCYHVILMF